MPVILGRLSKILLMYSYLRVSFPAKCCFYKFQALHKLRCVSWGFDALQYLHGPHVGNLELKKYNFVFDIISIGSSSI